MVEKVGFDPERLPPKVGPDADVGHGREASTPDAPASRKPPGEDLVGRLEIGRREAQGTAAGLARNDPALDLVGPSQELRRLCNVPLGEEPG